MLRIVAALGRGAARCGDVRPFPEFCDVKEVVEAWLAWQGSFWMASWFDGCGPMLQDPFPALCITADAPRWVGYGGVGDRIPRRLIP